MPSVKTDKNWKSSVIKKEKTISKWFLELNIGVLRMLFFALNIVVIFWNVLNR